MPELKRIPQDGRMNLDFHERILPPGQYREALNVNVGRSETSEVGTVENSLGNELVGNTGIEGGKCIGSYRDNGAERIFFFVTSNDSFDEDKGGLNGVYEFDQRSGRLTALTTSSVLNFHVNFPITGINLIDDLLFWTDDRNEPRKINIDRAKFNPDYYNSNVLMSVAKTAPYRAADVISTESNPIAAITSTFLEDKLPRFSYRWRFDDGEYSVLAPFTPIVFDAGAFAATLDEAVDSGAIRGFVNTLRRINLSVPITTNAGITSVELIYKDTGNTNLYIIEDKPVTIQDSINFSYESQDPFRTLPGSQLTRVFDAVPRRAKAQEVAGGRIVYGNYLQNYNLPSVDFKVALDDTALPDTEIFVNQYLKSRRTYEVGIVLSDESGRTTPVILSQSNQGTIFVEDPNQRLTISFLNIDQMAGFTSYKVVIKQRQQEYYNLFTEAGITERIGEIDFTGSSRFGDNASKVPIDLTQGVEEGAISRPSSRSIYVDGVLTKVSINQAGLISYPALADGFYEVEPFESLIDIFYESSTGGLISGLISAVDFDDPTVGSSYSVSYYNCYNFTFNGTTVEANRIRMGFNDPAWDYGVRAHAVNEEFAGEERRFNTLIHSSGFFNSRTGLNQLNQFNEAEGGLTISLDPSDGSIQKLFAEDTQLIIWQEDKVSRSPIDKDFIYSAEGGAVPVTSSSQYLGTIAAYAGEYGISTDPGSFAIYGTRKYFTDKNRGVVIRLSQDGLTEISKAGMSDFFRDALRTSTEIIGSFDEYHNTYNLTIKGQGYSFNEDTNRATSDEGYFTIGFEEDTNGWVSFKSYEQESGTTLNNTYYTFNGGNLWQHNSENVDRNTFYGGNTYPSYIDFIFNDSPSAVKTFNTIGYEGSSGWSCDYIQTDIDEVGNVPTPGTNFVRASLGVEVETTVGDNAANTRYTGERTQVVESGDTITWVIEVSPISPQYGFRELTDLDLTIGEDVIEDKSLNESNGNFYFRIQRTPRDEVTRYNAVLSGPGAELVFSISLLTVTITGARVNCNVDVRSFSLTSPGAPDPRDIKLVADTNHYLLDSSVMFNTSNIASFITTGMDVTATEDEGVTDINIRVPLTAPLEAIGGRTLEVNATALMQPILDWDIPTVNIPQFNAPLPSVTPGIEIYVSPRYAVGNEIRDNVITIELGDDIRDTHFIADDGVSDISVINGDVTKAVEIDLQKETFKFTATSDITDADKTTTVMITAVATEASLVFSDVTPIEIDYLGTDVTRSFEGNIDMGAVILPESARTIFDAGINNTTKELAVGATEITDTTKERIATVTVSPTLSRLTEIDQVLNLVQTGRYFDTPSDSNVDIVSGTGGTYDTTLMYPSTVDDLTAGDFLHPSGISITSSNAMEVGNYKENSLVITVDDTVLAGDHDITVSIESITYTITVTVT